MKSLFMDGGPLYENNGLLFISILTLTLIILFVWAIYHGLPVLRKQTNLPSKSKFKIKHLKSIGLFALIMGVLHQLMSLYSIYSAIEEAADINMNIVLSALRTSMIPLIYGLIIYLISLLLWFGLDLSLKSQLNKN